MTPRPPDPDTVLAALWRKYGLAAKVAVGFVAAVLGAVFLTGRASAQVEGRVVKVEAAVGAHEDELKAIRARAIRTDWNAYRGCTASGAPDCEFPFNP